ncbi:MAG: putative DNA binding domain-containing protein [Gemmatimonadetes bacterium]|nr:putative DNA binding domain-containing protein [Gemmatimonadota bacterium]
MNLAFLERMASEGDLSKDAFRYLLQCRGESEWLDYKQELNLELDTELCDFARDILALKNVGGGYIVVGVKDKTWEQVGLPGPCPYDSKLLRDKVMRATGVQLAGDVVCHSVEYDGEQRTFALVHVRSSKKRNRDLTRFRGHRVSGAPPVFGG